MKYLLRAPALLVALLQFEFVVWAFFVAWCYPRLVDAAMDAFEDFWVWYGMAPPEPEDDGCML